MPFAPDTRDDRGWSRGLVLAAVVAAGVTAVGGVGYLLYRRRARAQSTEGSKDAAATAVAVKTAAQKTTEAFAARTAGEERVHLFLFPPLRNISPSITPYGVRVEVFLRMHKIPYEKHTDGSPAASPNGCVPYITHKGRVIADSQQIMEYLDVEFHLTSSASADGKVDRAMEAAVRSLTNYCLIPSLLRGAVYEDRDSRVPRYIIDSLGVVSRNSPLAPALRFVLRKVAHYVLYQRYTASGFLLTSKKQYEENLLRDVESVESILAESPYIAGTRFSTADAALYSILLFVINLFRAERARLLATGKYSSKGGDGMQQQLQQHPTRHANTDEDALLDAIYVNDTLQYVYESEVLNAYVDNITRLAFPDMEEILAGAAITVTEKGER